MLSVKGLTKIYRRQKKRGSELESEVGIRNLDIEAKAGEFITLLGPSGCGKSTTLRCIAGVETPDAGEIFINNRLVFSATKKYNIPPEKRNVAMVFQSFALWPHLNVYENIAFPLRVRKIDKHEIKKRVEEILDIVGLKGCEQKSPMQLSGGQQQRVALCRALVYKPDVLLLDEPLSNLDARLRLSMRVFLKELQRKLNITTVYVTHDQSEAFFLSDRIYVLMGGECIQQGSPYEIIKNPKQAVAEFLGFDFMRGVVRKVSKEFIVVEVDSLGQLVTIPNCVVRAGDRVVIGVKPEKIELSYEATKESNTFEGYIEHSAFAGHFAETYVNIKGKRVKVIMRDVLPQNTHVYLHIPPESCLIYPSK